MTFEGRSVLFMDSELLKKAVKLFKDLELTEICLKDNGCEIHLKKEPGVSYAAPVQTMPALPAQMPEQIIQDPASQNIAGIAEEEIAYQNCNEIKAPLVGVFYAAKSPDCAPFVKLGDKVRKGEVVCIIEAMKMMNEVCADCDGIVIDICAENGRIVEFGQPLFRLR